MDVFLTIAGLIVGISFFLYVVNVLDAGKRKLGTAALKSGGRSAQFAGDQPMVDIPARPVQATQQTDMKNLPDEIKDRIPHRSCPLCSHILTRDEPLYASHIDLLNEKKVLIHGCQYCYKYERNQ